MRSARAASVFRFVLTALFLFCAFNLSTQAQRAAILTPEPSTQSREFAQALGAQLQGNIKLLDSDMSLTAYRSVAIENPFNLTADETKRIGAVIGCDAFILVRSANQRRSAFGRPEYYESYAVIYVASGRTGRLILWRLLSREAPTPSESAKLLFAEVRPLSDEIIMKIRETVAREVNEPERPFVDEPPAEGSPLAKGFRPPVPYRRIKPEYTPLAGLYEVTATVEALIDLDASGMVKHVEIVRWAGFGLDGSVERAIRAMTWRPAERNGKSLPMRFLVRYNFRKIDKDPPSQ